MAPHTPDQPHSPEESTPVGATESVGSILKRTRLERGLSLEQVAETTCIHIASLKALEENERDKLPANVFVRGFIKIYADHLGINPQELLNLYSDSAAAPPPPPPQPEGGRRGIVVGGPAAGSSFSFGRGLALVLLVLILVGGGYWGYRMSSRLPTTDETEPAAVATAPSGTEEQTAGSESPEPGEAVDMQPQPPSAAPPTATEPAPTAAGEMAAETAPAATEPAVGPAAVTAPQPPPTAAPLPETTPAQEAPAEGEMPVTTGVEPPAGSAESLAAESPAAPAMIEPLKRKIIFRRPAEGTEEAAAAAPDDETVSGSTETASGDDTGQQPMVPPAYTIKARFTELTWLSIAIDGRPAHEFTFRPGQSITWQAEEEIALHIGNAGGTILTVNGETMPPLGPSGEAIRLKIPQTPAEPTSAPPVPAEETPAPPPPPAETTAPNPQSP